MSERLHRGGRALLVVLILAVALTPAIGTVAATNITTRNADLAVQQPSYVHEDVSKTAANGTALYKVQGEAIQLAPTNFNQSAVVDFGIEGSSGGATLSENPSFDSFTLTPNGTGTYHLYWVVSESFAVNKTENGTTKTVTENRQVRYNALVRVTGGTNLDHVPASDLSQTRTDAKKWESFNATLHSAKLAGPKTDTHQAVQEMLNWYRLRKDPLSALTGNFTGAIIILVTTLGGAFLLILLLLYHQSAMRALYRALNIHEVTEAEEGTAMDKLADLDRRENQQILQNMTPHDIFEDDHFARAWQEMFGEKVSDGAVRYLSLATPRNLIAHRLRAMGIDGWVGVVERRSAPDGGDAEGDAADPAIESITLVREDLLDDDGDVETVDLETADMSVLVDAIDWNDDDLYHFDLAEASYDPSETETPWDEHDLDVLVERYEADMRHFDDKSQFGQLLLEFVRAVREHPFTDDRGTVDDIQFVMSGLLKHAQLLDDRFHYPAFHYHVEAIERALIDHNPEREAREAIDAVQNQRGSIA